MANAFHSAGQSVGATSAGAIVGSIENPYAAINLGGSITDLLTTGDIVYGDAGEMGGLSAFAVEFWFQTAAWPGSAQNLIQGPLSNSGANRQWGIALTTAGLLNFAVIDDSATIRSGTSAVAIQPFAWNHVVLTTAGTILQLYLNGVNVGSDATWGTHSVRSLGTTVGSLDVRITGPGTLINQYYDELAIYRVALSTTRIAAHYTAGTAMGFAVQKPGARISTILDSVSSTAPRSIQLGARDVVERYMSGQSPLEEMRRAVEAEDVDAALFAAADGTVTFLADGHRSASPYNTVQATFGDAGGAELPYVGLGLDYSKTFLINEWNGTRSTRGPVTPVTQTASDGTSISRYFKRSQSLSDVPTTSDGNVATIVAALLAKYKDPFQRVTSVAPKMATANVAEAVYRLELMSRVRIFQTPPGGGARFDQTLFVQSIHHFGKPGEPPQCELGVSPL